ncbi:MAG TPA: Rho termination factor N-terminal domain-containing protein, partial [Solirubrobacteraceae bacterium]|nr:Rho termination factor N-terminal domain-containing protein [Solirubrobacteraceae bacterium]
MAVFERSDLEQSPLADLHAIAGQIGLEGFRRLRKDDLVAAILEQAGGADADGEHDADGARDAGRRRERERDADGDSERDGRERGDGAARGRTSGERGEGASTRTRARRRRVPRSRRAREESTGAAGAAGADEQPGEAAEEPEGTPARIAAGVVEVLGNGSAFLRVDPPEPSDEDVYISAAQVRRCELVSGDRVTGPVRTPRRSERYPSLVRVDTINGAAAEAVADGARYDELPVEWPRERL